MAGRRGSDRALRVKLRSPGRPEVGRREAATWTTAQWHAERAGRRPKPAKLAGTVAAPGGTAVSGPTVLPCR